jgi:hypothetical protein
VAYIAIITVHCSPRSSSTTSSHFNKTQVSFIYACVGIWLDKRSLIDCSEGGIQCGQKTIRSNHACIVVRGGKSPETVSPWGVCCNNSSHLNVGGWLA